jgi:iron complex outermembrane receptor protein
LSTRYGWTDGDGAGDLGFTLHGGKQFNDGRTKVVGVLDFYSREFLGTKHREFASDSDVRRTDPTPPVPWDGQPLVVGTSTVRDNDFDSRSTASNFGNFVRGNFDSAGIFVGARPTSNRGIITTGNPSTTFSLASNGSFFFVPLEGGGTGTKRTTPSRNIDSVERDYYYNLNDHRTILPKTERINLFTSATHEFENGLTGFAELGYYRADSWLTRDPAGVDSTDDRDMHVAVDNPYNPFGSRFYHLTGAPNSDGTPRLVGAPAAVLIAGGTGVRPRDFHEKEIEVLSQATRAIAGVRGTIWDGYNWESAVLYSRSWTTDQEHFNIRDSALRAALARTDATAFNPFGNLFYLDPADSRIKVGAEYSNPASVVDALYDTFIRDAKTELATWDLKVSGDLMEFWGGPIQIAAGTEFRYETYSDSRPITV